VFSKDGLSSDDEILEKWDSDHRLTTIGVLLTPRRDGGWDTTLLSFVEWPELTDDELEVLRKLYPSPGQGQTS
jgi:hypothetical protein